VSVGKGDTLPTDTTPHPRNVNDIIAKFSVFFADAIDDCCFMYPSPVENVSTALLCFERLIGRLENNTLFHERATK